MKIKIGFLIGAIVCVAAFIVAPLPISSSNLNYHIDLLDDPKSPHDMYNQGYRIKNVKHYIENDTIIKLPKDAFALDNDNDIHISLPNSNWGGWGKHVICYVVYDVYQNDVFKHRAYTRLKIKQKGSYIIKKGYFKHHPLKWVPAVRKYYHIATWEEYDKKLSPGDDMTPATNDVDTHDSKRSTNFVPEISPYKADYTWTIKDPKKEITTKNNRKSSGLNWAKLSVTVSSIMAGQGYSIENMTQGFYPYNYYNPRHPLASSKGVDSPGIPFVEGQIPINHALTQHALVASYDLMHLDPLDPEGEKTCEGKGITEMVFCPTVKGHVRQWNPRATDPNKYFPGDTLHSDKRFKLDKPKLDGDTCTLTWRLADEV